MPTNPEQTLRERLAADGFPAEDDELGTAVLIDIDTALSVFREWLESEAVVQVATKSLPAIDFESPEMGFSEETIKAAHSDMREAWKRFTEAITQSLGDKP